MIKLCYTVRFLWVWLALFSFNSSLAQGFHVAVASNFLRPMEALKKAFQDKYKDQTQLTIRSGSTGQLYTQIMQGASFSLYLAANQKHPRSLYQKGKTAGEPFTYAIGRLVLWSGEKDEVPKIKKALKDSSGKIALANPRHAPYGQAALKMLQNLKIDQKLKARLVYGQNINQAYQFVHSGNASYGVVALSQVKNEKVKGTYRKIPPKLYPSIQQGGVLLKNQQDEAEHRELRHEAKKFVQFLRSNKARKILERFGYETPKE